MPTILGIESTCDETAASVVTGGRSVLSNVVATQFELHAKYRGVVPEIASRAHIENLLPVLQEALDNAACALADLDAIAVAHRPGLIGSLLIGVTAAKSLAWALGKPLIAIDHVHAHLYSVVLDSDAAPQMPAVGLVCSGGHTALYRVGGWDDVELIGTTIDDAVGEAYDKVARFLGLGYPGGPAIDRVAVHGDPRAVAFPRPMPEGFDFSLSGLKTAVIRYVRDHPEAANADVAASFQEAVVDMLIDKSRRAAVETGAKTFCIGGGVAANSRLRERVLDLCEEEGMRAVLPSREMCTDNAAMVAAAAWWRFRADGPTPLDVGAQPNLRLV